jgi:hypothetical protein
MRIKRHRFLATSAVVAFAAVLSWSLFASASANDEREEGQVRWDIVHITSFAPPTFEQGGFASAHANDGSTIMLTGSGVFQVGESDEVTGGGQWATFSPTGTMTGSGTYRVRRLIRFELAPGTIVGTPVIDNIGDKAAAHSGLVALAITYSDGSHGVLFVSCDLPVGTPPSVFEGITASKGFVDYWNRVPPADGVDGNRTAFHALKEEN